MVEVARAKFGAEFDDLKTDPCGALDAWHEVDFQFVEQLERRPERGLVQRRRRLHRGQHHTASRSSRWRWPRALAAAPSRRCTSSATTCSAPTSSSSKPPGASRPSTCSRTSPATRSPREMLLPDDEVSRHIDEKGPTADDVVASVPRPRSLALGGLRARCPAPPRTRPRRAPRPRGRGVLLLLSRPSAAASRQRPVRRPGHRARPDATAAAGAAGGSPTATASGATSCSSRPPARRRPARSSSPSPTALLGGVRPPQRTSVPRQAPTSAPTPPAAPPTPAGSLAARGARCRRARVRPLRLRHHGRRAHCDACFLVQPAAGFVGEKCADCA